jgi:tetratricopeptide (TPR) repeat protein
MRWIRFFHIVFGMVMLQVAFAGSPGSQLLFGDIDYGYKPPIIAGPHRLVMLSGMGNDRMHVDTTNPEAQRWFDYALTLARAFEHDDAKLAFRKAASLDPSCSLCVWGEAYSLGPTINFLVSRKQSAAALTLAFKAQRLAGPRLPEEDRRLESAMVDRYSHVDKSGSNDLQYAKDLDVLIQSDPKNLELNIFDAEAWLIMEFHDDRSRLAGVVARMTPLVRGHQDYTGVVHFYIHATEDAGMPQLAAPYASRLAELCPNASHLVHMPSHTYYRVGRYEAAALANVAALKADKVYAEKTDFPTPLGGLMYHFHDVQFGIASAMMAGDGGIVLRLVDQFNRDFPDPAAYSNLRLTVAGLAYAAFGRFAPPNAVLAIPAAPASKPFLIAMRHYARGEAFARLGNATALRNEARETRLGSGKENEASGGMFATTVQIAHLELTGRADWFTGNLQGAATAFRKAADLEDARFGQDGDPPRWWYPVRRSLAAALLARGDAKAAEQEADAVLKTWKLDPITLAVRSKAEEALKDPDAQIDWEAAIRNWHGDPKALVPGPLS